MRHGSPARDGIPSLHSDEEALPEVACLSGITRNDRDTPAELGDKFGFEGLGHGYGSYKLHCNG